MAQSKGHRDNLGRKEEQAMMVDMDMEVYHAKEVGYRMQYQGLWRRMA
jgi:hypothetical protein